MSAAELALLISGAVVAGFVQGLSGFGFSTVAMTLWVRGLSPQPAAVMGAFGSYVASGAATRPTWPLLPPVAAAIVLPSLLGGRLYHGLSEAGFRRVVLGLLTAAGAAMPVLR